MTIEEKNVLKEKILTTIKELQDNMSELEALAKPISPDNAIGRVSRMDAINNKGVNDKALKQSKIKLKKLHIAIDKINNNEAGFGKCKICGRTIQMNRLMFLPESSNCIRCAD